MKNLIFAVMALVIILDFLPVLNNSFVNWDDDIYITNNEMIRELSWASVWKNFTSFHYGSYKPLTLLTFAAEYRFVKLSSFFFHLNNLLLHTANFFIVFWLILLLFKDKALAMLTSFLFAVHPLRVESVAWATERKDLLYALFFLCSIIMYIKYRHNRQIFYYLCSFFSFLFSLLAKPQGIVLPLVLLLIDFIIEGKQLLKEKLPFIILALLFSAINIYAQATFISLRKAALSFNFSNILLVPYIIWFYISKTLFPIGLSNIYPSFEISPLISAVIIAALILLAVFIFLSREYTNKLVFGSLFFILPLLPVIQIVPSGPSQVADRYMYLPSIGLAFIFSAGWLWIFRKKRTYRFILSILLIFLFSSLCFLTNERAKVWKDSLTLWNDVIYKFPGLSIAYNNRAAAYMQTGNVDKAFSDLNKTIEINPHSASGYHDRGVLYALTGDFDKAIADYSIAIKFDPFFTDAYNDRGISYAFKGRGREAINDFTRAIALSPENYNLFNNRGSIYLSEGLDELAINDFNTVINFKHENIIAYKNRAMAYFGLKQYESSWRDVQNVQRLGGEMPDDFVSQLKIHLASGVRIS